MSCLTCRHLLFLVCVVLTCVVGAVCIAGTSTGTLQAATAAPINVRAGSAVAYLAVPSAFSHSPSLIRPDGRQHRNLCWHPPSSPWSAIPRPRASRRVSRFRARQDPTSSDEQSILAGDNRDDRALQIAIKPVTFHGLRSVSKLLVEEFYGNTLWFPAQYLVELNRLQSNFHSFEEDASRHLMLVATSAEDGSLAGFVDIDGRAKRTGFVEGPPRPYLSDLAVSRRHRRKGVGTALVRACESACVSWGYNRIHLKVKAGNLAADRLYKHLGYDVYTPKDGKNEVTLCGTLAAPDAKEGAYPRTEY